MMVVKDRIEQEAGDDCSDSTERRARLGSPQQLRTLRKQRINYYRLFQDRYQRKDREAEGRAMLGDFD